MQRAVATRTTSGIEVWPDLPYGAWKDTMDTVHMWTQVVGKVKLELSPFLNHWWNVAFTVTSRGLTTGTIADGTRVFQIDFDFIDHRLNIDVNDGSRQSLTLQPRSVADFYRLVMEALSKLEINVRINTAPQEVDDGIAFEKDTVHKSYDTEYVNRWWRILVQCDRLLQRYRSSFVGKSSPVLFWWGSFDLSESRFSGRAVPKREHYPARWMALGDGHEYANAGFWPGSGKFLAPAFFAYTYPEPPGCREAPIQPEPAGFHPDVSEFILPYDRVRESPDPDKMIMDFFQSTYDVGATLAGWDRASLERATT